MKVKVQIFDNHITGIQFMITLMLHPVLVTLEYSAGSNDEM